MVPSSWIDYGSNKTLNIDSTLTQLSQFRFSAEQFASAHSFILKITVMIDTFPTKNFENY